MDRRLNILYNEKNTQRAIENTISTTDYRKICGIYHTNIRVRFYLVSFRLVCHTYFKVNELAKLVAHMNLQHTTNKKKQTGKNRMATIYINLACFVSFLASSKKVVYIWGFNLSIEKSL